jgi:hypothetical protein
MVSCVKVKCLHMSRGKTYIVKAHRGINKLIQVDTLGKLIQLLENRFEAFNNFRWQFRGVYFILADFIVAITVNQSED